MHSAQCNDLLVCASITHNTNCLDGKQHSEGLTDLIIEARLSDLLDVDAVGLLKDLDLLSSYGPEYTDGETRTRERVALNKMVGDGEETAESANLVCKTDSR